MVMTSLPLIDIAPFLAGSATGRDKVAADINRACEDIGFFLITGHGVEQALIDSTYRAAADFFRRPVAEKLEIRMPSKDIARGYTPFKGETLSAGLGQAAPADLKEMIDMGPVDVPGGAYYERPDAQAFFHPNLWPARPEGFQTIMETYYRRMNALADDLMRLFAYALALPEDFFEHALDKNMSALERLRIYPNRSSVKIRAFSALFGSFTDPMFSENALRVVCYPEQDRPPDPLQLRSGAHTDYGTLTILMSDKAAGGLQAQHRDGRWIDVSIEPGTYVVNIGDIMQIWTNDRWVSTLHRVVNPPAALAQSARRHSLVFFHQPNYDALIETLPSCMDAARPPLHAPMTYKDHWLGKWNATRQ